MTYFEGQTRGAKGGSHPLLIEGQGYPTNSTSPVPS